MTFITATGEGGIEAVYADENVWLSQKMMGVLYDVSTATINYHLHKLVEDHEIEEDSVIRKFLITASDGKEYNTLHYNLKAIIAVGNKVDSEKSVQNRQNFMRKQNLKNIELFRTDYSKVISIGLWSWSHL